MGGSLGSGSSAQYLTAPMAVVGLGTGISEVSTGGDHACALANSGDVWCWGVNFNGQTGGATPIDVTPTQIRGLPTPTASIALGDTHSCAATKEKNVFCWGANQVGQLGNGKLDNTAVPVAVVQAGH